MLVQKLLLQEMLFFLLNCYGWCQLQIEEFRKLTLGKSYQNEICKMEWMAFSNTEALFTRELFKCSIIELLDLTEKNQKILFFSIPSSEWSILHVKNPVMP